MTWAASNQWNATKSDWDGGGQWDQSDRQWGNANGQDEALEEKVSEVKTCIQTVCNHNKWSDSMLELLTFGLDNALSTQKDARHDVQNQLITMIKNGIAAYKESLDDKQQEYMRAYDQFEQDCANAEKRIETLAEDLARLEASQVEAEESLAVEKTGMASLKEKVDAASEEERAVHQRSKELKEKITRTAHIYEREFMPMKKDYRAHGRLEKITAQLEKLGADEVLLKCIDVSLRSAERGELSLSAIAMAEKLFVGKLEELRTEDSAVDSTDYPKAKRHLESAMSAVEQQRENVRRCEKKVEESRERKSDAFQLKERAQKCIDDPQSYQKELQEELEDAEAAVQKLGEVEEALCYIEERAQDA